MPAAPSMLHRICGAPAAASCADAAAAESTSTSTTFGSSRDARHAGRTHASKAPASPMTTPVPVSTRPCRMIPASTRQRSAPSAGAPGGLDIGPWAGRVQLIDAKYGGTWELPALGAVTAPRGVLIRPDGYV